MAAKSISENAESFPIFFWARVVLARVLDAIPPFLFWDSGLIYLRCSMLRPGNLFRRLAANQASPARGPTDNRECRPDAAYGLPQLCRLLFADRPTRPRAASAEQNPTRLAEPRGVWCFLGQIERRLPPG